MYVLECLVLAGVALYFFAIVAGAFNQKKNDANSQQNEVEGQYCAQCGAMIEESDVFCKKCGTKQKP